jgi:5-amino-6-(5-phosphoribosylamino)uracil reductase
MPADYRGLVIERPYVLLSCGMSLDGYLDDTSGERLLLSNDADFDRVDAVRATCDAILVGASTIRSDNPRLLVRSADRRAARVARGENPNPVKVTVTSSCHLDPNAQFFTTGAEEKLVYCASPAVEEARARFSPVGEPDAPDAPTPEVSSPEPAVSASGPAVSVSTAAVSAPAPVAPVSGTAAPASTAAAPASTAAAPASTAAAPASTAAASVSTAAAPVFGAGRPRVTVVDGGDPVDVRRVSTDLAKRGIRRLMVEGGGRMHTQFLTAGIADELQLVIAPFFVGDSRAPRFVHDGAFPWGPKNRADLAEVRQIGDVVLLRYALSTRFTMG